MLRWVLAGIGIFLVVLLYWFGRADKRNYRKRANHVRSSEPVEPYLSDEALSLDLDASQREEISREIQSSTVTNGVFDKVDEFYEEVVESETPHDDVVSVPTSPELPSFSATSDPQDSSAKTSKDVNTGSDVKEPAAKADIDALTNVPAWLQQNTSDEPVSAEVQQENSARHSGTVGLFQNDSRDPKIAPRLPEKNPEQVKTASQNSTTQVKKTQSSNAMPENYSEKIKQAVAAVTNIERSEEESVPENRNLFDKLPRSSKVDSGIQKENVFDNDKGVELAKESIVEAGQELEKELIESKLESESVKVSADESEVVQVQNEGQKKNQEQNEQKKTESSSIVSVEENQQEHSRVIEQSNTILQGAELAEKGKSTAAGGQTVFYPSTENENESTLVSAPTESGKIDSTELPESNDSEDELQKAIDQDSTVVRIDPTRFRNAQSHQNVPESDRNVEKVAGEEALQQSKDSLQEKESDQTQKEVHETNISNSSEALPNSASIQVIEVENTSHLLADDKGKSNQFNEKTIPSVNENAVGESSVSNNNVDEPEVKMQKKKRVNGFDRDNPDADLISFYLINKNEPYKAKALISLAADHGLELTADGTLYMAQDTGFAKDYVFGLRSIDDNSPISRDENSDDIPVICFKLLQGKEIVGRLNTLDSMLRLAKRIETDLGGILYDVGYCPITDLMISHLRRQIQENDVKNCQ